MLLGTRVLESALVSSSGFSPSGNEKKASSLLINSPILLLSLLFFSSKILNSGPMQEMISVCSFLSINPRATRIFCTSWLRFLVLMSLCLLLKSSITAQILLLVVVFPKQITSKNTRATKLARIKLLLMDMVLPSYGISSQEGVKLISILPPQQSISLVHTPLNPVQMYLVGLILVSNPIASQIQMMSTDFLKSLRILMTSGMAQSSLWILVLFSLKKERIFLAWVPNFSLVMMFLSGMLLVLVFRVYKSVLI